MPSAFVLAAVLGFCVLIAVQRKASQHPRPPGPPGYPLVGNIFDEGGVMEWKTFSQHRARWGDMTSVNLLGTTIVTLHTYEKAVEILDKKSSIYSSRPTFHMYALAGLQDHVTMLPYGSQLRGCRRMLRSELNQTKLGNYHKLQESATVRLVLALVNSPERFYDRIEWYIASLVLKIVYGYETEEEGDSMISVAHKGLAHSNTAGKSDYLIELIPWMRYIPPWFPFAEFQRSARTLKEEFDDMRELPFEYAVRRAESDQEDESFVHHWLLKKSLSQEQILYVKESALISFTAGFETTSSVLLAFVYKMQEHPDIQKQAQLEIDSTVGRHRLPAFEDQPNLPYISALAKELLRYHPPAPAGLPHQSTSDDIHDGYFIPKGSVVVPSISEMSRDPDTYKDPDTFNPSRFLGPTPERDPALYVFGFGRRICSGLALAQNTLFISMAMILASFDISATDATSSKMETDDGLLSHPLPFHCRITKRADVDVNVLRQQITV